MKCSNLKQVPSELATSTCETFLYNQVARVALFGEQEVTYDSLCSWDKSGVGKICLVPLEKVDYVPTPDQDVDFGSISDFDDMRKEGMGEVTCEEHVLILFRIGEKWGSFFTELPDEEEDVGRLTLQRYDFDVEESIAEKVRLSMPCARWAVGFFPMTVGVIQVVVAVLDFQQ